MLQALVFPELVGILLFTKENSALGLRKLMAADLLLFQIPLSRVIPLTGKEFKIWMVSFCMLVNRFFFKIISVSVNTSSISYSER